MDEYISVSDLKNVFEEVYGKESPIAEGWIDWVKTKAKKADVEPVIHAHWIKFRTEPSQPEHMKCSNCGQFWSISNHANIFKLCFNCGAKMDEEEK